MSTYHILPFRNKSCCIIMLSMKDHYHLISPICSVLFPNNSISSYILSIGLLLFLDVMWL